LSMQISKIDLDELARAKYLLEHTSFACKIMDFCGRPVEWTVAKLPAGVQDTILSVSHKSMEKALHCACWSLPESGTCWPRTHLAGVMTTGAAGGFFGLPGLYIELPVSTMIILRSIAEIARFNGESLQSPETRFSCLHVFALGGRTTDDDAMDSAYLTMRFALANEMRLAVGWLTKEATAREMAPFLIRLIQTLAARFSVVVQEKLIAQSIPVLGAVGGASINAAFMDHFQDKAKGHFTYRRLERKYDPQTVEEVYRNITL